MKVFDIMFGVIVSFKRIVSFFFIEFGIKYKGVYLLYFFFRGFY